MVLNIYEWWSGWNFSVNPVLSSMMCRRVMVNSQATLQACNVHQLQNVLHSSKSLDFMLDFSSESAF